MAESNGNAKRQRQNIGRVEQVQGVVVDVALRGEPARDLLGADDHGPRDGRPP